MHPRDLSTHVPYEAGRGIEEVARELDRDPTEFIKLASNENALGPSPAAIAAIRRDAGSVHSYPKATHADLCEAIAERFAVDPAQVWLANGGDGAIDYLSRAVLEPGDSVLVPEPGFAYYGMSARFHHGTVSTYPLDRADDFNQHADTVLEAYDGDRVVYVTSPHNPTGSTASLDTIERIADETDDETLLVVDEAYGEFSPVDGVTTFLNEEDGVKRDDIAVLRTFSKAYGLAGLRLGFAIVPRAWASAYTRVNTPFAAGELACRAGLAAIDDIDHLDRTIETVEWSRSYMREQLDAKTWPSGGNFLLVDVGDGSSTYERLLESGIIVRDCTSFGLPACIRVTCGTEEETHAVVEAINEIVGKRSERVAGGR